MQQDNRNADKNRKSEAQKRFEEADNAGRFAGDDNDAQAARTQMTESIRQDTTASQSERERQEYTPDDRQMGNGEVVDGDDVRPAQANMLDAEAQNISGDRTGDNLMNNDNSIEQARNKATQGIKEGRDTGTSDDRGSR